MKVPVLRAVFAALMLVLSAPDGASAQTAPAAKPAKVELEPGGKPVKITLQGKVLDAFAGAQVVLKNRPVKDIEAKLDKGSAKKRVLTLVAKPGAKAEKGYKIQLIDEKTKKPVDLKVKLVIAAANAPPAVVKIEAPKQVEAGIAFEVKISVSDDKGVALVVLTVGGKSQKIKARGRPKEVLTVKLKAEKAGKLAIEAVAVDKDKAKSEPVNAVVDVTGLNQPPVIAKIEAPKAVGIGVAFEVKIAVSDDKGVALVVLTVGGKSQKIKAKGRPKEVLTVKLKAEKAGKLAIEAVAVDKDNAKSKPVKAAVDVTGLNQPPVIAKIEAPKAVGIGVAFEVKIAASDDKGVALVVLTVGGKPQKIKAKGRPKEVLTVKLKAGKAGTLAIEAVAVDNDNAKSKPVKAAVDVTGLNQPPVIAKIEAPKAVEAGAAFEIKITATDDRGLAEVVLTVGGKPQTLKAKGQPQEVLTAKLTADKAGKLQIEAVAVDGDKATSKPAIASVDVGAPKPAAGDRRDRRAGAGRGGGGVRGHGHGHGRPRACRGRALTVGGTAQTLTAQGRTKETLTATLVAEKAGTLAIEAVAIDGDKAKSTPVTASVDVGASNQPPVVAAIDAPAQVEAGAAFEVTVTATDDRGLAGVVLTVGGTAQTLNAQGRTKETLTATLTAEKAGTLAIEAVAIDGDKATGTPVSASIAVGAPNQPPVIAAIDAPEQVEAGAAFEVTVTATDDRGLCRGRADRRRHDADAHGPEPDQGDFDRHDRGREGGHAGDRGGRHRRRQGDEQAGDRERRCGRVQPAAGDRRDRRAGASRGGGGVRGHGHGHGRPGARRGRADRRRHGADTECPGPDQGDPDRHARGREGGHAGDRGGRHRRRQRREQAGDREHRRGRAEPAAGDRRDRCAGAGRGGGGVSRSRSRPRTTGGSPGSR